MGDEFDWMTVSEAAEWSGYHPHYLRELIRKGKIEAVKKGSGWWVIRQSVEDYLKMAKSTGNESYGPRRDLTD